MILGASLSYVQYIQPPLMGDDHAPMAKQTNFDRSCYPLVESLVLMVKETSLVVRSQVGQLNQNVTPCLAKSPFLDVFSFSFFIHVVNHQNPRKTVPRSKVMKSTGPRFCKILVKGCKVRPMGSQKLAKRRMRTQYLDTSSSETLQLDP